MCTSNTTASILVLALSCGGGLSCDGTARTSSTGGSESGGAIRVQINGEEAGYAGIAFPGGGIVDGWEIHFDHVLFGFDHVSLASNPDKAPSDQSRTDEIVARLDGPWVADLAVPGSETGADGTSKALLIGRITHQNANGGSAFESDKRYAFTYQSVLAAAGAKKLNLDAEAEAYYEKMIGHYSVLYVGTATWKGEASCPSSNPAYYANEAPPFPTVVRFELGFATPTHYINCQNQDNRGEPVSGENYQRGIPIVPNGDSVAQITVHLDHVFFDDVSHDTSLFFDPLAASLVGKPSGTVLHTEDLRGIDPTALTDATGAPLPFRTCNGSPLHSGTQRSVKTGSVPVNPSAASGKALHDYFDFVEYVQSTQGHLNGGDGLCFVKRDYPSPP